MNLGKIFPVITAVLFVAGCGDVGQSAVDPVIWEVSKEKDLSSGAWITKVEVASQSCDSLDLNVSYIYDGNTEGRLKMFASARDLKDQMWPYSPDLSKGEHTQVRSIRLQDKGVGGHTALLTVAIEHVANNSFVGYKDKQLVEFEKDWSHNCKP